MTAAADTIAALLDVRGNAKTVCPSEVARALAGPDGDWRSLMSDVHLAVDTLASEKRIALSWKGKSLPRRDGPYRIAHPR